jgi:ferrous iron transport protein B
MHFETVDLPGTYSLAAVSPEESVVRDYLLDETPDVVILVVDAANAERNLYLTVQILELGVPSVVALNMSDTAEARGLRIDRDGLERGLGVPVIRTVARRREGIDDLLDAVVTLATERAA